MPPCTLMCKWSRAFDSSSGATAASIHGGGLSNKTLLAVHAALEEPRWAACFVVDPRKGFSLFSGHTALWAFSFMAHLGCFLDRRKYSMIFQPSHLSPDLPCMQTDARSVHMPLCSQAKCRARACGTTSCSPPNISPTLINKTLGLCHSPANYHVLQPSRVLHTVALLIIMGPPGARGESCTCRNACKQELLCTLL
jgi:hypothetical protein